MTAFDPFQPLPLSNEQAAIELLLRERMGLNAASIGSSSVLRVIYQRMSECGMDDIGGYYKKLLASTQEFTELVESVTVPETWFFRTLPAFTAFEDIAKHEWLPTHLHDVLHILSVPCSTGEEPYSIAMSLLNLGFQPAQFIIDAVDINTRNLANAKRGLYTRNSFRNQDLSFRDKYFTKSGSSYALNERVKNTVNLIHGNLIDPLFMPGNSHYDVIFCRNLLIYFDHPTQERAFNVLDRLLAQNGALFLGHAEGSLALNQCYSSAHTTTAFAFRRNSDDRRQGERRALNDAETISRADGRAQRGRRKPQTPSQANIFPELAPAGDASTVAPVGAAANPLDTAFRNANEGHLVEAATLCETYLCEHGPNAQAYYLLALVRDAVGNKLQADEYLRKAIYLDPNHYEALIQLAVLAEQQSDHRGAQQLRQRAQRVKGRLTTHERGSP